MNMLRNTIGLSVLLFLSQSLLAQNRRIEGFVLDQNDRQPLPGAHVSIPSAALQTVTGADGSFVLEQVPEGELALEISFLGKVTHLETIAAGKTPKALIIRLEDAVQELTAVMVASRREADFGLSRLRAVEGAAIYEGKKSEVVELRNMSANLAANNPRQVFSRITGLNIWESDGAGLQLGIGGRGLSPNRTANFNTRQNGYDISADALGYPESYYTPPAEALARIEVVRGAASLQYGTQFGGLLNFVFKKPPEDKKVAINSRQTVGSFGFMGSYNELSGTLAAGKFSYFGFWQHKRGDGWRPNSGFKLNNGFLSLQWQPTERLGIQLEVTRMHYLAQQPGGLTDVLFEQDARQSFRERNWFNVDWNLAALTFDYRFSERTRLNMRTFGLDASRHALGNLAPINVIDFGQNRDLISGNFRNLGHETRLLHRYTLGGQEHIVVTGVRFYQGRTTARQGAGTEGSGPDFFYLNPENIEKSDYAFPNTNYAAFAEQIIYLGKEWSLTPGVRYEYIDTRSEGYYKLSVFDAAGNLVAAQRKEEAAARSRGFLLAGAGLSWKPNSRYEWYANCSQNYRAINFSDLRIDNPNGRVDANITDERGYTADLGWRMREHPWLYADVTAFYIAYQNRIGQVLRSGEPPLYNDYRLRANIADARNIGLEGFAEIRLSRWLPFLDSLRQLNWFVNASAVDARYIRSDDASIRNRQVELVPPLTLRTGLSYRGRSFKAAFTWAYTGEHYTDATNARRTSSAVNGIIPAYVVADISVGRQWRWLSLEASCNNLFDNRYFTRRADAYPGPGIIPADGRAWFVTVGVSL